MIMDKFGMVFVGIPTGQCFKELKKARRRMDRLNQAVEMYMAMDNADAILYGFSMSLDLWKTPKWKKWVLIRVLKLLGIRVFNVSYSSY